MDEQKSHYFYKVEIVDSKLRLGFSIQNDYTLAVVPRFWFTSEKNPKIGKLDSSSKILIVPDKGERIFESTEPIEHDKLEFKWRGVDKKGEKKYTWAKLVPCDPTKIQKMAVQESNTDAELLEALYVLLQYFDTKASNNLLFLGHGSNDFRVFLFKSILEKVRNSMRELRRSYKEIDVRSTTIRGRINIKKSAHLIASNSLERVCTTEDFSLQSEHYSALMTAFDHITSYPLPSEGSLLYNTIKEVKNESAILRSRYREIPSQPFGMAIRTLRTAPLPATLKRWKDVFNFALYILEGAGAGPNIESLSSSTQTTQSSQIWEKVLLEIFEKAYPRHKVHSDKTAKMVGPWDKISYNDGKTELEKLHSKKPDILVIRNSDDLIIDAKYYDSHEKVMQSTSYQLLSYALHGFDSEIEGRTKDIATRKRRVHFAIPMNSHSELAVIADQKNRYNLNMPYTIADDAAFGKHKPILQGMEVQFPGVNVFTKDEWVPYLDEVSQKMIEVMKELDELEEETAMNNHKERLESQKQNLEKQIESLTEQIESLEQEGD